MAPSVVAHRSQRYSVLKKGLVKRGEIFVDNEFPANSKSLFYSRVCNDVEWKRPQVLHVSLLLHSLVKYNVCIVVSNLICCHRKTTWHVRNENKMLYLLQVITGFLSATLLHEVKWLHTSAGTSTVNTVYTSQRTIDG